MQNTFELPDGGAVTLFGTGCTVETGDGTCCKAKSAVNLKENGMDLT